MTTTPPDLRLLPSTVFCAFDSGPETRVAARATAKIYVEPVCTDGLILRPVRLVLAPAMLEAFEIISLTQGVDGIAKAETRTNESVATVDFDSGAPFARYPAPLTLEVRNRSASAARFCATLNLEPST